MAAVIPEAAGAVTEGTGAVRGASAAGRARAGRAESIAQGIPQRGKRAGRNLARARVPGNRNYQPVILAEFLLAVLVVALAPIAKGGTDTAKSKGGGSPYDTNSLKQILVIGVVYFVLALASSGKRAGRFSAWFGGLVLVAIGVQQTVNGGFLAVIRMFLPGTGEGLGTFPAGGGPSGALPPLDINAGNFSPGALAQGVQTAPGNPTDIFPTIQPGGAITPPLTDSGSTHVTIINPPPGGTGTTEGPTGVA